MPSPLLPLANNTTSLAYRGADGGERHPPHLLKSLGVGIYASGHRRWPDAVKAQAVADTLEPGATVNAMSARYGVLPNQLPAWRRLVKQGKLVLPAAEADGTVFAPLVVFDVPETPAVPDIAASEEEIRILSGLVRIELAPGTPAARIAEIVHAPGATPC
ncbi:transposase [Leisingera aquimarina]|uniref:transposase n=1 Tax=Leisingera aquimarina TaxID=476529 RepID=UPI0012EB0C16|nr:transposase [Leisingera aquimarina]